jgi:alkanesulfonate monooxygenase SsuD/methylene tetrahydromethanopterin reductase-like flavin-dependent oxidoreductase (luciferase family)
MLRYVAPLKLAEDMVLLESLFPGRIDLGTIGAITDPELHAAVLDTRRDSAESYAPNVVRAYRNAAAEASRSESEAVLVCYDACAGNTRDARKTYHAATGPQRPDAPGADFLGAPADCFDQIMTHAGRFGATEVVVQCFGPDLESRRLGYELFADAFQLPAFRDPPTGMTPLPQSRP